MKNKPPRPPPNDPLMKNVKIEKLFLKILTQLTSATATTAKTYDKMSINDKQNHFFVIRTTAATTWLKKNGQKLNFIK
jgi:hypothetical protein